MKLVEANNNIELNELKIKSLRASLLSELKLNSNCSHDRVKVLVELLDSLYSYNIDLRTKIDNTRSYTLVSGVHLTKFVNNIIVLSDKIKFYNEIINEVLAHFNNETTLIDAQLRSILNSISDSIIKISEDLVDLKKTVFSIEMSLDLSEIGETSGSDTIKQE